LSRPSLPVVMVWTCTLRYPVTPCPRSLASASKSPVRSRPTPLQSPGGKLASKDTRLWTATVTQCADSATAGTGASPVTRRQTTAATIVGMGVDITHSSEGSIVGVGNLIDRARGGVLS